MSISRSDHDGSAERMRNRPEKRTVGSRNVMAAHALASESVLQSLQSNPQTGLPAAAVEAARQTHGWNELAQSELEPAWKRLARQFEDVVVWILIFAAVISGVTGDWTDALVILAIILLNAMLGFLQEDRAERALAALQQLAAPMARVIRAGQLMVVPSRELVPGDLVLFEAGDQIPADLRLLTTFAVRLQEASLTGESLPVEKAAEVVLPAETSLADRRNMAYMTTVVANGQGRGLVVATGMQTEIGRIAGMLQTSQREPTPLQQRLAKLGRVLVSVCLALVGLNFGLGLVRGRPLLEALLSSVSLAVAAVPEGLPAVVTMALALGLQRMARRNALIRKLPSVETLGCVSVICSDKTGTLTRNEMTVREVLTAEFSYQVSGTGYEPVGQFRTVTHGVEQVVNPQADESLLLALRIGAYCNHAEVQPGESEGVWKIIGDPTEGALIVLAMKGEFMSTQPPPQILEELPFDSDRKRMSVLIRDFSEQRIQLTKGAPEHTLACCQFEQRQQQRIPLTDQRRQEWLEANSEMSSRALRVLALACRQDDGHIPRIDENELTFVGLVGMIDPPRDEVEQAVARCHAAGIQPVMITGDHPGTAWAIARELGIALSSDHVATGQELEALSDEELTDRVAGYRVYARVSPEHKLRIVKAWKRCGAIVAMTGDGVNDAPAVNAADIGIAMGVTGTDVTRAASSMVLMDDNFASIVDAVEEGRAIYDNIQKFLLFLLSCNAGELLLMLVSSVLGWPIPLLPVQLLWINLVTDGLPALALAMEPPEPGIMQRRPRPARQEILSWGLAATALFQGMLLATIGLITFSWFQGEGPQQLAHARGLTFCVVVYGELFRALAARSQTWTFWQLGPLTNPSLFGAVIVSALLQAAIVSIPLFQPVFQTSSHSWWEWTILALLALTPVTVIEVGKIIRQFWSMTSGTPR